MDLKETAVFLKNRNNFIILTHSRPDGDTVGSAAALCRALRALGKTAYVLENDGITKKLEPFVLGLFAPSDFKADTVAAVDIADEKLFSHEAESFSGKVELCIDHHPSNVFYARNVLLDAQASATGLIIWRLINELGVTPDKDMADAVYLAAATDTGCFKFSNTTSECHETAARCIASGADFNRINTQFFVIKSKARLAIENEMISSLRLSPDEKVGIACLSRDFIDSVNAESDDMDNGASILMQVETLVCGILMTESSTLDTYRISVRTREGANAGDIGMLFNGGGHDRAAGGVIYGEREDCIKRLMDAALQEIERGRKE